MIINFVKKANKFKKYEYINSIEIDENKEIGFIHQCTKRIEPEDVFHNPKLIAMAKKDHEKFVEIVL